MFRAYTVARAINILEPAPFVRLRAGFDRLFVRLRGASGAPAARYLYFFGGSISAQSAEIEPP